jgi:hypothetical protein
MKNLKEYILESSNKEKFKEYVSIFKKYIKDIEQVLSKNKLTLHDYILLSRTLSKYFDWAVKEKLGYCDYLNSEFMVDENHGISGIYKSNGELNLSLKFVSSKYGPCSVSTKYRDFIKNDKYEADYGRAVFDVEKCIRDYFTSYIKAEFERKINMYSF